MKVPSIQVVSNKIKPYVLAGMFGVAAVTSPLVGKAKEKSFDSFEQTTTKPSSDAMFLKSINNPPPAGTAVKNTKSSFLDGLNWTYDGFSKPMDIVVNQIEIKIMPREMANDKIKNLDVVVNTWNKTNPDSPLSVDYSDFPDPKNFIHIGSKKERFANWKYSLDNWYEKEKNRLETEKDAYEKIALEGNSLKLVAFMDTCLNRYGDLMKEFGLTLKDLDAFLKDVRTNQSAFELKLIGVLNKGLEKQEKSIDNFKNDFAEKMETLTVGLSKIYNEVFNDSEEVGKGVQMKTPSVSTEETSTEETSTETAVEEQSLLERETLETQE